MDAQVSIRQAPASPGSPWRALLWLALLLGGLVVPRVQAQPPVRPPFDHLTTGFELLGQHRDLPCESCHINAIFRGTPKDCAACHGIGTQVRATAKPANHIISTDQCEACHTPVAWKPAVNFDHTQALGSCSTCHNGTRTQGKPPNHIVTDLECDACHTTLTWTGATFAHAGVKTDCARCHDGVHGAGLVANHIPISASGVTAVPCEACHSTTEFTTWAIATMNHAAAKALACAACHETAAYIGMHPSTNTTAGDSRPNATLDKSHPTTGDCGSCHTTTPTFASDVTSGAKPANHIPTNAPCAQCHTTAGNFAAYSVTGTHQGVTSCLSCHGSTVGPFANVTMVTSPGNHIPIGSLDCSGSGCHSTTNVNPGGFHLGAASLTAPTLAVAGHTTVAGAGGVSGCQTCHETSPYLGMIASTATAAGDSRPTAFDKSHPTSGDCNGCHTTTPTFTSNVTAGSKPANHIPTSAPCAQCHTTAGNFALYVMGATGHTGITSNCAQCHAYGLSFANMAPPTLVEPPSGATGHIPAVPPNGTASIACELCHSPTVFTTFSGTVMKHAYVTAMKCDSCHEFGMTWKTNSGQRLWTRPSASHHAGQDCGGSGCHSPRDKHATMRPPPTARTGATTTRPGTSSPATASTTASSPQAAVSATTPQGAPAPLGAAAFSHASVSGTACVSCHTTANGSGKPASHITTSNACQNCHTTLAWLPVTSVDHTQVLGSCASCHNGTIAKGKSSSHLPTSAACANCHTTNAWTPARFDHAAVAPHTCTSCHNSVRAIGKPRTHIPTTLQCDSCHGTLAWTPVKVDHTALTASCASCHNNASTVGVSPGHLLTRIDCASCHAYPDWSMIHFRHASAVYPGNHRAPLACVSCHTSNTDQVPWPSAADAGSCGGCHAKDFKPAAHPKTLKGGNYSAHELDNCSGACHVYSDTTQSTIKRSLPGPHHRVTDATFKR